MWVYCAAINVFLRVKLSFAVVFITWECACLCAREFCFGSLAWVNVYSMFIGLKLLV